MLRAKSPTCSVCRTICAIASITTQAMKGSRNVFVTGSKRLSQPVRRLRRSTLPRRKHAQRKNLDSRHEHPISRQGCALRALPRGFIGRILLMSTVSRTIFDGVPPPVRPLLGDQVEDLQRLQKAAQKISSILDLDQLIDKIVNDVARSFGCLEASIYLHDEIAAEMVMAAGGRMRPPPTGHPPRDWRAGRGGGRASPPPLPLPSPPP